MGRADWLQRLTPFDRKLVVVLAVVVGCSFLLPLRQGLGARVLVNSAERTIFVADLDQDQQVDLSGPLGVTRLQIEAGSVRVISSPCRQKICIGLGEARYRGDLLACVPNRLVARIAGRADSQERGYDLLSR